MKTKFARALFLAIGALTVIVGGLVWRSSNDDYELKVIAKNIFLAHKSFSIANGPLPTIVDDRVHPSRSWRVELHPYISNNGFLSKFDKRLPFDSPTNLLAAKQVANVETGAEYRINSDYKAKRLNWTSILRIAGADTLGRGFDPRMEVPDGNGNTILFVICSDSGVLWTKPADLDVVVGMPLEEQSEILRRWFESSTRIVVLANGQARKLHGNTTFTEFVAMCTSNGGEAPLISKHKLYFDD